MQYVVIFSATNFLQNSNDGIKSDTSVRKVFRRVSCHLGTYVYVCVCVCVCVYIYVCVYVCVYISFYAV